MVRRLLALIVGLLIAAAPVAATMCQATCESHEMQSMADHAQHHSCDQAGVHDGMGVAGVPHVCGHEPAQTTAVQQIIQSLTAPAEVALDAVSLAPPAMARLASTSLRLDQSPPGLIALTSQLRV
jgi:hypothetical protein